MKIFRHDLFQPDNIRSEILKYADTGIFRYSITIVACYIAATVGDGPPTAEPAGVLFSPFSGVALGVLLLFGRQFWPGVLIGSLLVNLSSPLPLQAAAGISLGNTLAAWLGATLLYRYSDFNIALARVRDVLLLLLWGAMAGTFAAAFNGAFWLEQQGLIEWQRFANTGLFWWMGDILGVMFFTPLCLKLFSMEHSTRPPEALRMTFMLGAVLAALWLTGFTNVGASVLNMQAVSYLFFPVIVFAALCLDMRAVSLTLVAIYSGTVSSIKNGEGIFSGSASSGSVDAWAYNIFLGMAGLTMLVANEGRYRVNADKSNRNIHSLSNHDALTGLPNRSLLHDRISQQLAAARRDNLKFSLICLDLDRFKHVNNSMGHGAGDRLLQGVAQRLIGCVREVDTVSRIGGDEFVMLLRDTDAEGARIVAERLLSALLQPYNIDLVRISTFASIGISVYPDDADDTETLIKHANLAMCRAKEDGENSIQIFTDDMGMQSSRFFFMETDLRRALENGEFELHYQPQVDLTSGRICGVEALIRWHHPLKGIVSPGEFIPVAEETGQIVQIGDWVLRTACRQIADWRRRGMQAFPVSVNLSLRQLWHPGMAQTIKDVLQETALYPDDLELEITESIMMAKAGSALSLVSGIHDLGVQLAIDDFGTGYSSLSYLRKLPVNCLKIDQSFLRDLGQDYSNASIVGSIINLGHQFKLQVIAEGVETREQVNFLRARGCDEMQGYYFSKPLPPMEFMAFVNSRPVLK